MADGKILSTTILLDNNNYELHENALILGEVKSTFPKILYHKDEVKGKESLETIIDKLFGKLDDFYKLYQKINPFSKENGFLFTIICTYTQPTLVLINWFLFVLTLPLG